MSGQQHDFPNPDGAGDIIKKCEECENLIFIRETDLEPVMPCPICGCLNEIQPETSGNQIRGNLVLTSPIMDMERGEVESGQVALPHLPMRVQEALLWLQENRWRVSFVVDEDEQKSK